MSEHTDFWSLRQEQKDARRKYRRAMEILREKHAHCDASSLIAGDDDISAIRYFGCRIDCRLTVVRSMDSTGRLQKEKSLRLSQDWRNPEVSVHVEPTFASEISLIRFSPLDTDNLDFTRLHEITKSFSDRGRLISTVVNFFNWGVTELNGEGSSEIVGFDAEVTIERYYVADCIRLSSKNQGESIWVNVNTDQAWRLTQDGEVCAYRRQNRLVMWLLSVGCFTGATVVLWWLAFARNTVTIPPVTPEVAFGFSCFAITLLAGVFIKGVIAKIVVLCAVVFGSYELVPWIGEAWDMTSDVVLAQPFPYGEWVEAPLSATYIACSVVLMFLTWAVVPSLMLKVSNTKRQGVVTGLLFAVAFAPWPMAIPDIGGITSSLLRCTVCVMLALTVFLVGQCGSLVSAMSSGEGAVGLLYRRFNARQASFFVVPVASIIVILLVWSKLRLMW